MRASPLAAACLLSLVHAQHDTSGGPLIPEQAAFDVQRYALTIAVDPDKRAIEGELRMEATLLAGAERIALDLDERLHVDRVEVGGAAVAHQHRDGRIWIPLPAGAGAGDALVVTVAYGGQPREAPHPPWSGGFTWSTCKGGQPWIATTCQGEGADLWWPCKDHPSDEPATMDLHVTVPKDLVCASNGTLVKDERHGATRTFHWHIANPISNYNVALNIAPYAVLEDTYQSVAGEAVPVRFWVLPEHRSKAVKALPEFLEHLRFFEEICGPYPFRNEKYGIAETPHLGMEHQTCIAYGNRFVKHSFGYDWLHHHELSHEWWGNLVTCRDWKDMWIHEGIGTYMQALYVERKHGRKGYLLEIESQRRQCAHRRPVAPRESQNSQQIYFGSGGAADNDIYTKGAVVMHTLRWVVGDEALLAILRRWCYPTPAHEAATDGSQCRLVDTDELLAIAEQVSGQKLGWLFDVYLHQAELPVLEEERQGDVLRLRWRVPGDLPFPMPVPVVIDGQQMRVELPRGEATVEVAGKACEVDPEGWVLRLHL